MQILVVEFSRITQSWKFWHFINWKELPAELHLCTFKFILVRWIQIDVINNIYFQISEIKKIQVIEFFTKAIWQILPDLADPNLSFNFCIQRLQ